MPRMPMCPIHAKAIPVTWNIKEAIASFQYKSPAQTASAPSESERYTRGFFRIARAALPNDASITTILTRMGIKVLSSGAEKDVNAPTTQLTIPKRKNYLPQPVPDKSNAGNIRFIKIMYHSYPLNLQIHKHVGFLFVEIFLAD